jgi:integrase
MAEALTVKRIEKLLRAGVPSKTTDGEVKGLMLCVEGKKSAHWLLRFQINKKTFWMGLGSALAVARDDGKGGERLEAVRKRALQAREQIAAGHNPLELKRSDREAQREAEATKLSFRQAAERCHAAKEAGWSSAHHADEFMNSLERYAFPHIGNLDVAAVGRDDVLRVLEQTLPDRMGKSLAGATFWTARPVTADRTRNRIQQVLDWAEARGYRAAGTPNPARWKGFLDLLLAAPRKIAPVRNMAAVPFHELPSLMAVLAADATVGAQVVRLVVLTAGRLSEALKATWDEFSLEAAEPVWTIPASRMKGRREHRVPLAPQAVALLRSLYREDNNPHVFVSSKTPLTYVAGTTVTDALRRAGRSETLHGMRASFKTWAEERTNFAREVCEMALAHRVGDAVENAYRRTDLFTKRRRLMEAWATFCCTPPAEKQDTVVPLLRA